MTNPTGSTRPLPYYLKFSEDLESITPPDAVAFVDLSGWTTIDNDEKVDVVIKLSLNEYVALANTIDVGRDIAYGDNSIYIWWLWTRIVESLSICESVANCIGESQAVQDALNNFNQQNTGFENPSNNTIGNAVELINPTACDYDEIWGNAVALWSTINQTTIDTLEKIKASTNPLQAFADVVSAIPVVGLLPVDEALGFIDQLSTWSLENYQAGLTVELERQIQCDLFCLMIVDCTFSFDNLFQYFQDYFTEDLSVYTLIQYMTWMTGIAPTGTPIVYLMSVFQLYIVSIAETYFGISTTDYYAISSQLGEPDNDWNLLCDECITFEWTGSVNCKTGATIVTSFDSVLGQNYTFTISGSGVVSQLPTRNGDAFYYNFPSTPIAYSGAGFQVDGAYVPSIPTYQASHEYTFVIVGTGSPFNLRFFDGNYTDNNTWSIAVTITN